MESFKNIDNKTKILIGILIFVIVIGVVFLIVKNILSKKDTSVEQIQLDVLDVAEDNIEIAYNADPVTNQVEISILNYDNEYNLYYYIYDSTNTESSENTNTTIEQNTEDLIVLDSSYILYTDKITTNSSAVLYLKYEKGGEYSSNAYMVEMQTVMGESIEGATEEELQAGLVDPEDDSNKTSNYYIKINTSQNTVTVYEKDSNNEYTEAIKAMVCSTGTNTPTSGVYKISDKYQWRQLYGEVYGQYVTRIVGGILFQSVPYNSPSHDSLDYVEYDKLGTQASIASVRLTVEDAKWIYDYCPEGTMVEFYQDSTSGPLGKPEAMKISSIEDYRNYDPTDPVSGNPWETYVEEEEEPEEEQEDELNEQDTNTTNSSNTNTSSNNSSNVSSSSGASEISSLAGQTYTEYNSSLTASAINTIQNYIQSTYGTLRSVNSMSEASGTKVSYSNITSVITEDKNYSVYVETEYTYNSEGVAEVTGTYAYIY